MSKLPNNISSVQNSILVTTSSRFPLLIDPQDQVKNQLVNMYPIILEKNMRNKWLFSVEKDWIVISMFYQVKKQNND